MSAQPDIREGDIWKEVDPRVERFVRVERVGAGRRSVTIRTVVLYERLNGERYWIAANNRLPTRADRERFNGKRSGYALHYRPDEEQNRD